MIICKPTISKQENMYVGFIGMTSKLLAERYHSDWTTGGGGDWSLDEDCFVLCMSLHMSLYGAMVVSISCLKITHLSMKWPTSEKWLTTSFASRRALFWSLVVSWGLSTTCQNTPHLLITGSQLRPLHNMSEHSSSSASLTTVSGSSSS